MTTLAIAPEAAHPVHLQRAQRRFFATHRLHLWPQLDHGKSHVKVQVVMPGDHIDQKAVRRASRRKWSKLLAAGVELYEYEPTMNHTKLLIVDGTFVSVGSTNFDPRSLRINDEINLNVLDEKFAREQTIGRVPRPETVT